MKFKECTLTKLDKLFGIKQVRSLPALQTWLDSSAEVSELERQMLRVFQEGLIDNVYDWNEQELSMHFIGPILSLVNFTTDHFNLFAEREIFGSVDEIELSGKPDGMIASGVREPETPFFCFHEYKRFKDPDGDPAGQCLAPMLVAQELNEYRHPIYGCYVIGHDWYFMVLEGKQYAMSYAYVATRDDLFDIFRILKALKPIISELIAKREDA